MCGFSGLLTANHSHPQSAGWKEHFASAARKIAHRGTDDERMISFNAVSLHHFRLAFQDVESGRQPMLSKDGRLAITFNGEIYNHLELRRGLEKNMAQSAGVRKATPKLCLKAGDSRVIFLRMNLKANTHSSLFKQMEANFLLRVIFSVSSPCSLP